MPDDPRAIGQRENDAQDLEHEKVTSAAELAPGTVLRWVGDPDARRGCSMTATLSRRKTASESPHLPGWWVEGGGGLADFIIEEKAWEVVTDEQ